MKYTYKEMRAFAVDFAYYIYGNDLGTLSHERHKEHFDDWIKAKLPQTDVISRLTIEQILEYECHSHWLASWISFNWGQELIAWCIARKIARKYGRYSYSLDNRLKHK